MAGYDLIVSLVLLAWGSFYTLQALALPQGLEKGVPRAGTLPLYLGILLILLSLLLLAGSLRTHPASRRRGSNESQVLFDLPVLSLVAALAAYLVLLWAVGFVAATLLFVAGVLRFYFRYPWLASTGLAVAVTGACFLIFQQGLRVPLPTGMILG